MAKGKSKTAGRDKDAIVETLKGLWGTYRETPVI